MEVEYIKSELNRLFPNPKCELEYQTNYELLVAVILSAQCTDKRVNLVTKELFKNYNTPEKMIKLSQDQLEKIIRSCGFYRNKAKNILSMSRELVSRYNGQVPSSVEELQTLAGVGRKTANVVFAEAFKGEAIAVDTHVLRVSNRLGFIKSDDPYQCEMALMEKFDKTAWGKLHLQMVLFGRYICKSQKPKCEECPLVKYCIYNNKSNIT